MTPRRGAARALALSGALLLAVTARAGGDHPGAPALAIDAATARALADRIRTNETGGRAERLLWWNAGEAFASLGIGHFIWYPEGRRGPFVESFPALLAFLERRGVALPAWLGPASACPWPTREAFLAARGTPRMRELRRLLAATVPHQAAFIAERVAAALPALLAAAEPGRRGRVERRFRRLAASTPGLYALADYVNFKGEGVDPGERYRGAGWGLLQVLDAMTEAPGLDPLADFAAAAERVLERRVANAPPARGEARWLPGWRQRVRTYRAP